MSPRQRQFAKETVLTAAFALLREAGWSRITARAIAESLQASTMPIYSALESMDKVAAELRKRSVQVLGEYQLKQYTDNPLLNLAIGYVTFAQEERHLFRFLFFEQPQQLSARQILDLQKHLPEDVRTHRLDYMFTKINPRELDAVMLNSWIFTHGLATLLHGRVLTDITSQDIINMLNQAGEAFAGRKEYRTRAIKKRKRGSR